MPEPHAFRGLLAPACMFPARTWLPQAAVRLADVHAALYSSARSSMLSQGPLHPACYPLELPPLLRASCADWRPGREQRAHTAARSTRLAPTARARRAQSWTSGGPCGKARACALWKCCGGPPACALQALRARSCPKKNPYPSPYPITLYRGAESALLPRAARRWTASRRRCRAAPSTPPSCPATAAWAARLCTRRSALPLGACGLRGRDAAHAAVELSFALMLS